MKCDHIAMGSPDACPNCGAIYAKVEDAAARGKPIRPARSAAASTKDTSAPTTLSQVDAPSRALDKPAPARAERMPAEPSEPFVKLMRRESLYPTFRSVVSIFFWLGILFVFVSAALAVFSMRGAVMAGTLAGLAMVVVLLSFMREASLMLADLSDAAVRMAERQEERPSS